MFDDIELLSKTELVAPIVILVPVCEDVSLTMVDDAVDDIVAPYETELPTV